MIMSVPWDTSGGSNNVCTYGHYLTMFHFFLPAVPRSKTGVKRKGVSPERLKEALKTVKNGGKVRTVAREFGLKKSTLHRYAKSIQSGSTIETISSPNYAVKKVFSEEEEKLLLEYIIKAAKMNYGLSARQTCILAYQFAVGRKLANIPEAWNRDGMAGRQWLFRYRTKYPELSLRKPESTSLARAICFNKVHVEKFYNNLKELYQRYEFNPQNIYNLDETGCSTVHKPEKVLAPKSLKLLGKMTSGERGENVTMIACINAAGNFVPPMIIFPRVHFKDNMMKNAPPGSIAEANRSGWSTEPIFRKYLQHFIKCVKPAPEHPVLLILDNHETHISYEIINIARDNGIHILTLPPHTSHRLQPLDKTVFGPFKTAYNKAADLHMINHPGIPITIYDSAELIKKAFEASFLPKNIINGFESTGIYPFNDNIFTEDDFAPSSVTDQPEPPTNITIEENFESQPVFRSIEENQENLILSENQPFTSQGFMSNVDEEKATKHSITPEMIRPLPKFIRKESKRGRKKGSSRILTNTPEKESVLNQMMEKENKVKGKGKGKSSSNTQLNLDAPIAVKTTKAPAKKISILCEKIYVTCKCCHKIDLKEKFLQCSSCNFYYHQRCCPKNYQENIPDLEDSELFMCADCFKLDDSDDDGSVEEIFKIVQSSK